MSLCQTQQAWNGLPREASCTELLLCMESHPLYDPNDLNTWNVLFGSCVEHLPLGPIQSVKMLKPNISVFQPLGRPDCHGCGRTGVCTELYHSRLERLPRGMWQARPLFHCWENLGVNLKVKFAFAKFSFERAIVSSFTTLPVEGTIISLKKLYLRWSHCASDLWHDQDKFWLVNRIMSGASNQTRSPCRHWTVLRLEMMNLAAVTLLKLRHILSETFFCHDNNLSGLPLACLVFRNAHRAVQSNWRLMHFWHLVAQRCFILYTSLHMHTQGSMLLHNGVWNFSHDNNFEDSCADHAVLQVDQNML